MTAIHDMTAGELLAAYKSKKLSPVEVTDAVIAHIEAWEPKLKALYAPDFGAARTAAKEAEKRWQAGKPQGSLDGVPITIKENIATKGVPVPLGTAATELDAGRGGCAGVGKGARGGAIILAKTTMPDYGMLSSGRSSFHALTRNPWNLAWNPGGSSSGGGGRGGGGLRAAASRDRHWRFGTLAGLLERHLHPETQPRPRAGRSAVLRSCHRPDDAHGRGFWLC